MAKRKEKRRDPLEPIDAIPDVLAGRAKPQQKRRDRSWDAARTKATYDLPADLIERINQIAEELGAEGAKVKVSDVARLLLVAGLEKYDAGELKPKLRPTGFRLFED